MACPFSWHDGQTRPSFSRGKEKMQKRFPVLLNKTKLSMAGSAIIVFRVKQTVKRESEGDQLSIITCNQPIALQKSLD